MKNQFKQVTSFDIVVPGDTDHSSFLSVFNQKHRKEFFYYDKSLTDENLEITSPTLVPGDKFRVRVCRAKEDVAEEDCINFLNSKKASFLGAHGLALIYEQAKDKLFSDKWAASYGYNMVSSMYRDADWNIQFIVCTIEDVDLHKGDLLYCICPIM